MAAIIRRHRYWFTVFVCILAAGMAWMLVWRLRTAQAWTQGPTTAPSTTQPNTTWINPNANPGVQSVAEAHHTGHHTERLSPLLMPEAFDQAGFNTNPQAYLNVVEPGRVWQTADPGPGNVTPLLPNGNNMLSVVSGGTVALSVIGVPSAPVTFTSFDGGAFDNQLNSMTVQADGQGQAQVNFTATPGTIDRVHIMVGSPLASYAVQFEVKVTVAN